MEAMSTKSASPFYTLLFLLLLSHALLSATALPCPPLSCGQLQNISYPFRRRDDPPDCGEPLYKLNCQGNKSTISISSVEYLVTDIPIFSDFDGRMFRLVDPNFVNGGSCGLPSQSLSPSTVYGPSQPLSVSTIDNLGYMINSQWASFMNCSKPINDSAYWPVPCVNSSYTSSFVYVFIARDGYELRYLPPSCQFISMIPVVAHYNYPKIIVNSTADAINILKSAANPFNILQQGFDIFFFPLIKKRPLLDCLDQYYTSIIYNDLEIDFWSRFLLAQVTFYLCLQQYVQQYVPSFPASSVVAAFIQILWYLLVLLILVRLIVAPFVIWFFLSYKLWSTKRHDAIDTIEKFLRHQQTLMPKRYAYTDIIAITRHFKEKLGQGGFGFVFKGELAGGILVAVKMMGSSKCNGDEFINEVSTIGRIHHVNVVRLVGYCSEGSKRALVYEYMHNGSLDKYIFSNRNGTNLHTFTSEKLIDIAMGVARGINYLHRGCDMQILHFDIKPHNILLDYNFTPKISDFGLARLYPKDNSLVSISAIRGTIGYIAPELISRSFGVISQKSDVYSYGMLLMEMAGRRRNVDSLIGNSSQVYYPSWIYDKLNKQQEIILENNFEISEISELEKKLATIALWCIQMKSFERPIMAKVIEMLESNVETIPMPPKPFLSSMESILENRMCLGSTSTELSVVSE